MPRKRNIQDYHYKVIEIEPDLPEEERKRREQHFVKTLHKIFDEIEKREQLERQKNN